MRGVAIPMQQTRTSDVRVIRYVLPRSAAKSARQGHLINVFGMCVVHVTSTAEAPYFALSYVCGGVETLDLTSTNEANLSIHGSLSQQKLP